MRQNRTDRGFGPFTGRQLTVIICITVVAVVLPLSAFAVTGTNSFITDAVTGKHANVDGAARVMAAPTPPNGLRVGAPTAATGSCTPIATLASTTQSLLVTTLNVSWSGMTPGTDFLDIWRNTACNSPIAFVQVPTASGSMSISLGEGVKIAAGQSLSATGFGPNPKGWVINAPSYVVPASS